MIDTMMPDCFTRGLVTIGRKALSAGLPPLLLAAGLAAATGGQPPGSAPGATQVAVQETQVGTFSNSNANVIVTKRVSGSGPDRLAVYIADVILKDATALRGAFARGTLSRWSTQPVSAMAKANNAALAVNCDWSGFRMNGIIIRNGKTYVDMGKRRGFAIYRDGSASLYDETKTTADELLTDGAWQTVSFGPGLVQDGEIASGTDTFEIGDSGSPKPGERGSMQGIHPRAGIGFIDNNHFLLVGVDGYPHNGSGSRGVTVTEFAQIFVGLGVKHAYNFDGGGSWTMYFNGSVINIPGDEGSKERLVGDIFYIAK